MDVNSKNAYERGKKETLEKIRKVWLAVQFLDHYDGGNDDYWHRRFGNEHVVSMHASDYEKMQQVLKTNITPDG